jgi:aminomethyltransferase
VSHMGEFDVRGDRALEFVNHVTTNDAAKLEVGQAQYSTLLNDDGRLLDDLLVYRYPEHYMLVVNGANREKDFRWIAGHADRFGVELVDRSDDIGLLALQGPRAEEILARLTDVDLKSIPYYRFVEGTVDGVPATISRTGYTGEDGFELYLPASRTADVWRRLLEAGRDDGLIPAGLGARDSLRLEMGYALYGNDLDEETSPLEAGLGWVVKLDKGVFVGADALRAQKEAGVARRLVGFRLRERGFPRQGYEVSVDGAVAGVVTSGTLSPTLGEGIGMAYVPVHAAKPGTEIGIVIRGNPVPAEVVRPPFHRGGTVKSA